MNAFQYLNSGIVCSPIITWTLLIYISNVMGMLLYLLWRQLHFDLHKWAKGGGGENVCCAVPKTNEHSTNELLSLVGGKKEVQGQKSIVLFTDDLIMIKGTE